MEKIFYPILATIERLNITLNRNKYQIEIEYLPSRKLPHSFTTIHIDQIGLLLITTVTPTV